MKRHEYLLNQYNTILKEYRSEERKSSWNDLPLRQIVQQHQIQLNYLKEKIHQLRSSIDHDQQQQFHYHLNEKSIERCYSFIQYFQNEISEMKRKLNRHSSQLPGIDNK